MLLERIEDKNVEVMVSASKAQKIKGWDILVKAFEIMNQLWANYKQAKINC